MYILPLLSTALVSFAAVGAAHGGPRLFGRRNLRHIVPRMAPANSRPFSTSSIEKRDAGAQCGPGLPSCAANECCSSSGVCDTTKDACMAPDCQFMYGPACDANRTPTGANTSSIARPKVGSEMYGGAGIYGCDAGNTVALTFDDGPWIYTENVLNLLKSYNAKATFFITGINIGKGAIDDASTPWPGLIRRMYAEGHQVASHTWSHQNLSSLTTAQRKDQMIKLEMAVRNILGFFPAYMRPPYSACDDACSNDLADLGYHIVYFDLDTDDYNQDDPLKIQTAKNNYDAGMAAQRHLVIGHDIDEQTAHNLTEYMLKSIQAGNYRSVTVGDCVSDPSANWYRR